MPVYTQPEPAAGQVSRLHSVRKPVNVKAIKIGRPNGKIYNSLVSKFRSLGLELECTTTCKKQEQDQLLSSPTDWQTKNQTTSKQTYEDQLFPDWITPLKI